MFRKRKQIIKDMQESISVLTAKHYNIRERVIELEQKVKQLECKHNFIFNTYRIGFMDTCYVHHKCTKCGKTITKQWDFVVKKEQQALKLLNLVPKDWKIKGNK